MNKKTPRYKNDIFVTSKHLTRTINTYIAYEDVTKIYLSFNEEKNKYQIFIKLVNDQFEKEYKNAILVYDKNEALSKRLSTDKILQILNSIDVKEYIKDDTLESYKNLIEGFIKENHIYNSFFERDKNTMISKLKLILTTKGSFVQQPSGKVIQTADMVAKRMYYTVLNRLNYKDNFYNKLSKLKNEVQKTEIDRLEQVQSNLLSITNIINNLKTRRENVYVPRTEDTNISYKDCVIALDLYDDSQFDINDIAPSYDIDMLLREKTFHEEAFDADIMEENLNNKVSASLKIEIAKHFQDFIKLDRYITTNKKNFTSNAISRYINDFLKHMKVLNKLGGSKRKIKVNQLIGNYGKNFRDFHKKIKLFSNEEKHYFIKKLLLIKDYSYLLDEFIKEELEDIFHGNILFQYTNKPPFKSIVTLSEIKINDDYETIKKENESLNNIIVSGQILPSDYEYEDLIDDIDILYDQIRDLNSKYKNHKYHPWAKQYLQDKLEDETEYLDIENSVEIFDDEDMELISKYQYSDDWFQRVDDLYDLLRDKGIDSISDDLVTLICARSCTVNPANLEEWLVNEYKYLAKKL